MPPTVLVVDDERTVRETLASGLQREGYGVLTAADGAAGCVQFGVRRPDLILLDFMLMGHRGFTGQARPFGVSLLRGLIRLA
jgi:DNA-binding response OmpR family regulator